MDGENPLHQPRTELYHRALDIITKRWWAVACTAVLLLTGVFIYLARAPRIFEARASIVIDSATPQVLGGQFRDMVDVEMGSWWSAREYIQTQYHVIQSESLAREVAARLDATGDLSKFKRGDGEKGREAVAKLITSIVTVEPVKDSRIVYIVIRYTNPELAALLANSVAETYIDQNLERRLISTRGSASWLGDRLGELKDQLEKSELALYEFRRQNNVLSVSIEDSRNILSNEIQKLADAVNTAKTNRIQLAAKRKILNEVQTGDPVNDPIPELKENDVIAKLKETLVDQNAKLLEAKGKYLDKHPMIVTQEARVEAVRKELHHEAQLALKSLEAEYRLTVETERSLVAALEAAKQQAIDVNKKQIEFDRLKRTADNNAKTYDLVLGRLKESDLAVQLRTNNVRIQDRARVPMRPTSPNVPATLGGGIGLALLLGLGVAFLLDFLDNTVKSQQDIDQVLGVPFLGLIPRIDHQGATTDTEIREQNAFYIVEHPKSTVAECCRAIRTSLLFMSPERPLRSLLVTSAGPQEGKTTTSINLGVTMAQSGGRVLLIDTDLRRPRFHRAFGVPAEHGMSTLILGESQVEDVIKSTHVPNLYVIPCGPLPPNPAELLHTERFREIVADLCSRYDRVIFDSPPIGAVTDAAVLSTIVDGTVLVAMSGQTTKDMLGRARRQLAAVNANILGCVLNEVDLNKRNFGYTYYYDYGRYGSYYGDESEPNNAG